MSSTATATATISPALVKKVERLVSASEKHSYDPFTEIDWDLPIDDSMYHLPPEHLPLYGTPQWDAMSETERMAYSRHECAALCSAGIFFEGILMDLLLGHLYDMEATNPVHRFHLIEIADECRHSAMFGEYVRRADTPSYRPHRVVRTGGRIMKALSSGPEGYVAILAAEEILDFENRQTMRDERVHPTSRAMARLHVLEEARHVSFAKTMLTESFPTLPAHKRLKAIVLAPLFARGVVDAMVNPAVSSTLKVKGGFWAARKNAAHNEVMVEGMSKLTEFLTEAGIITSWIRPLWKALGLVAK